MLSEFIKNLRIEYQLTQEDVAAELNISRPTYIQVEQGKRELTMTEAKKLAQLFNLSLDELQNETYKKIELNIKKSKPVASKEKNEIRINIPQERIEKFKQVLIFILEKIGGLPNVGQTYLYKLLYFIDFDYYEKHEEQLMGLVYIKNHHGPTPIVFEKVIQNMVKNHEIEVIKTKYYDRDQKKYLPKVKSDLTFLNGQELEHIQSEIQRFKDYSAKKISELSHRDVPWLSAKEREKLEYESVFYRTSETSVRQYDDEEHN